MKRTRVILALILALALIPFALPALAEAAPADVVGSWKIASLEFDCEQGAYGHVLDVSNTVHLYNGYGTHLTFGEGGALDTDVDLALVIEACPKVPFDIPALSLAGEAWTLEGDQLTLEPSGTCYAVRTEDGQLILEYKCATQARNDGNPNHFTDGEGSLTVTIGLERLENQPTEEPASEEPPADSKLVDGKLAEEGAAPAEEAEPEPTEEPTPEPTEEPLPTEEPTPEPTEEPLPTEEPTPEPTEEPTPEPTEEPTPEPTEEPAPDLSAYAPAPDRSPTYHGYDTAQHMAEKYGVALTDGAPLYTPAHPQPLNAYMVTREDCDVGINRDDMYKVSEKGLVESITKYLVEWSDEIMAASGRTIRFVSDPDDADILVVACQTYEYYGLYGGGGVGTCSAYSSRLTLKAVQLTNPRNTYEFSAVNQPGSTITTNGGSKFWKYPPEIEGTQNLDNFVTAIQNWYGGETAKGITSEGVKVAQQALIDRGFLEGGADGSFGPKTEEAVKRLQQAYGLEETGIISGKTLVALYFNQAAVDSAD